MKTNTKQLKNGTIELAVELDKQELEQYIRTAKKYFTQNATIKGFRKGKAPEHLIDKHIDVKEIRQNAMQEAISDSLSSVIKSQNLDVARSSNLVVQENGTNMLRYSVQLNVFPSFTLSGFENIKVTKRQVSIEEKEMTDALEVLMNMKARFSSKEGSAEMGDRVETDFQTYIDGNKIENGESKNHPLIIGGKSFMPGFEEQLIGLREGEEKKFSLEAPNDYFQKDIAGKKIDFVVKINRVQTVQLPKLDDAFAQSVGQFENLGQLKAGVRDNIKQEKESKETNRARMEALNKIAETTKFSTPEFLVEEQLDTMMASFENDLHAKGLELSLYLAQLGKQQDELRKDWEKSAEKQTRLLLVLREITKIKNINVTNEEIENSVNQALGILSAKEGGDIAQINVEDLRKSIAERLINEKTLEFVEKTCVKHAQA